METGRYRNYSLLLMLAMLLGLAVIAGRVVWGDPLWQWRDTPPWVAEFGGHNRIIDTQMRRAKALQVVTRRPRTVILGASGVYRGLDPADMAGSDIYNLGLTGLKIAEAEAFVNHLALWTPTEHLVLALNFRMFSGDITSRPGFEPDLGNLKYLPTALPTALLTRQAWQDVDRVLLGERQGDGVWRRTGFKVTNPRSADDVKYVLESYRPFLVTGEQYASLERLLERARQAGMKVTVFLGPRSLPYLEKLRELGEYQASLAWREKVREIVQGRGLAFYDLSENSPFSAEPIPAGSTEHWIDSSHYQPVVGRWVLQQIGLAGD